MPNSSKLMPIPKPNPWIKYGSGTDKFFNSRTIAIMHRPMLINLFVFFNEITPEIYNNIYGNSISK